MIKTVFVCDRCGKEEAVAKGNFFKIEIQPCYDPEAVISALPSLANPYPAKHYCSDCKNKIQDFINKKVA